MKRYFEMIDYKAITFPSEINPMAARKLVQDSVRHRFLTWFPESRLIEFVDELLKYTDAVFLKDRNEQWFPTPVYADKNTAFTNRYSFKIKDDYRSPSFSEFHSEKLKENTQDSINVVKWIVVGALTGVFIWIIHTLTSEKDNQSPSTSKKKTFN